jgi:hypothetical protein
VLLATRTVLDAKMLFHEMAFTFQFMDLNGDWLALNEYIVDTSFDAKGPRCCWIAQWVTGCMQLAKMWTIQ